MSLAGDPATPHADEVDQATIDRVFGSGRPVDVPVALPKGLSPETAELVLAAVRGVGEISASETADELGLSRVTARRYLEHFRRHRRRRGAPAVRRHRPSRAAVPGGRLSLPRP